MPTMTRPEKSASRAVSSSRSSGPRHAKDRTTGRGKKKFCAEIGKKKEPIFTQIFKDSGAGKFRE